MKKPYKCPVCLGRGTVQLDFYEPISIGTNGITQVQCRSCLGTGIVFGEDDKK